MRYRMMVKHPNRDPIQQGEDWGVRLLKSYKVTVRMFNEFNPKSKSWIEVLKDGKWVKLEE